MPDYGLKGKYKEVFDFLSEINKIAYKDVYLLSNEVFSKNPFSNNFLKRFLKEEKPKQPSLLKIFFKLGIYYLKSFLYFGIYLLFFLAFYISGLKNFINPSFKELILIDTYFIIDRIAKKQTYEDPYFIGLKDVLEKFGKHYAYLSVFYSTRNPLRLFKIFKLLKREKVPVLSEYQLLSVIDFFRLLWFILVYPVRVLKFIKSVGDNDYKTRLLISEIVDNLSYATFFKFSRYLQGKRISNLNYKNIKLISWFENQAIDKNLYKGAREGCNGKKVRIYGAQPFLAPRVILNVVTDESELKFGIVPDKIVVNGTYFLPRNTNLDFIVGPSFRYGKIFTTECDAEKQTKILILISFFDDDTKNILDMLGKTDLSRYSVIMKAHPFDAIEKHKKSFPPNAMVLDKDLYELFKETKIAIGAASGTLVEAASLGIPVISVKNNHRFDYNPLPDFGKGIIWDEVTDSNGLEEVLAKFENALINPDESDKIKKIAHEYKKMFFCKPTEKNIITAYELYE